MKKLRLLLIITRLFYAISLALLFMGCNTEKTEEKAEIKTEPGQTVIEEEFENEALMDSLIENLSRIEYYYVKVNTTKKGKYISLLELLEYKKDPNYNKLKPNFNISTKIVTLDLKNGYLAMGGLSGGDGDWNAIRYYTYWNLKDGSGNKLLAVVLRSCDFVCQDDIEFYRIIKYNSENSGYRFEEVETNDIIINFDKLPEILIGHEIDDYYPISYNLPQMGKNILMCSCDDINLNPEDDNSLEKKGWCIELIWDGNQGTFTPGEQAKR